MKRFWYLVVLMVLSSSAYAGDSLSFVVGGHRIRIEAPRHCNSPSCVSVSIPGIYESRRWRDSDDDDDRDVAAPARPPVTAPEQVQAAPPASRPAVAPVVPVAPVAAPPPAVFKPAAAATQEVAPPPPPAIQPPPAMAPPVEQPADAARPRPEAAPQVSRVSHEVEDEPADTPIGDWQSEGNKGSVRIERCGRALCGYVLNPASSANGETVLINIKPKSTSEKTASEESAFEKTASEWSGNIYSLDSGAIYYVTIALKSPNSLRVEACALGRFFCTGNVWSRIGAQPTRLITSRQVSSAPRS